MNNTLFMTKHKFNDYGSTNSMKIKTLNVKLNYNAILLEFFIDSANR